MVLPMFLDFGARSVGFMRPGSWAKILMRSVRETTPTTLLPPETMGTRRWRAPTMTVVMSLSVAVTGRVFRLRRM